MMRISKGRMIRARVPLTVLVLSAAVQVADVPCVFAGPHDALIAKHAAANGVPESLVRRVIQIESRGNPRAVSKGNSGLMQIRLGTARGMGYRGNEQGLLDADTNMTYAVKYLAGAYRAAGCNEARAVSYYQRGYHGAKRSRCATPQPRTQIAAAPAAKVSEAQSAAPLAASEPEAARAPVADVLKPRVVRTQAIHQPRPELPAKPLPAKPRPETVAKAEPQLPPQPAANAESTPAATPAPAATAKPEPVPAVKPEPVMVAKPPAPAPAPRMNLATALSIPKPRAEPAPAPRPAAAKPDAVSHAGPPVADVKPAPPAVEPALKPTMKWAAAPLQPGTKPVATQPIAKFAPAPSQVAAVPTAPPVPASPAEVTPSAIGKIDLASVRLPVAKPEPKLVETKARKKKRERVSAATPATDPTPDLAQAAKADPAQEPTLVIAKVEPDAVPIPAAKPDVMPTGKPEQRSHQRAKRKYARSSRKAAQPTDLLTALKNLVAPDKRTRRRSAAR
jgi:hypothetical protein